MQKVSINTVQQKMELPDQEGKKRRRSRGSGSPGSTDGAWAVMRGYPVSDTHATDTDRPRISHGYVSRPRIIPHIAKQIQHSKLANRQLESQKQRKISRPLTSGPAACRRHRAGEPGDSSGPRASSFPASGIGCAGLRRATWAWARVPLQGSRPELGPPHRRGSSRACEHGRRRAEAGGTEQRQGKAGG